MKQNIFLLFRQFLKVHPYQAIKQLFFSDLIKASFGSNNKSVNDYLKNIEYGSNLYEELKSGQIPINTLDEMNKKELATFRNHLTTLYNNTLKEKKKMKYFHQAEIF